MTENVPTPPDGLKNAGEALWGAVQGEYELEEHEAQLLLEMCRTVDALDALHALVERDGELVPGPGLVLRVHPAMVESRHLRIAFARLVVAMRLPAGEDTDQDRRPQRRGIRGVYAIDGGGPATRSARRSA
jgi:hypothetical protein